MFSKPPTFEFYEYNIFSRISQPQTQAKTTITTPTTKISNEVHLRFFICLSHRKDLN